LLKQGGEWPVPKLEIGCSANFQTDSDSTIARALLHNKVKDSPEELDVLDGRDAQTDPAEP